MIGGSRRVLRWENSLLQDSMAPVLYHGHPATQPKSNTMLAGGYSTRSRSSWQHQPECLAGGSSTLAHGGSTLAGGSSTLAHGGSTLAGIACLLTCCQHWPLSDHVQ